MTNQKTALNGTSFKYTQMVKQILLWNKDLTEKETFFRKGTLWIPDQSENIRQKIFDHKVKDPERFAVEWKKTKGYLTNGPDVLETGNSIRFKPYDLQLLQSYRIREIPSLPFLPASRFLPTTTKCDERVVNILKWQRDYTCDTRTRFGEFRISSKALEDFKKIFHQDVILREEQLEALLNTFEASTPMELRKTSDRVRERTGLHESRAYTNPEEGVTILTGSGPDQPWTINTVIRYHLSWQHQN